MMQLTFESPINLWFLVAIPLFAGAHFFFLRYAKRRALLFANFRALKRITGKSLVTRNYLLLALRLVILLLVVLAVSGATLWYDGRSNNNDFVIAIDSSASMTAQDVKPTRLDAAKNDAQLFVDALTSDARIGVVTFSGVAIIETVPVSDKAAVKKIIANVEPLQAGGTDIPGAIITSTNLLLDNTKGRAVILLTDGSNTIETFLDASMQRAVTYAKEHHVTIHTVGIGTNMGPIGYLPEYYNVSAVYNADNLIQIANATGGTYAKAETADQLVTAFQMIVNNTNTQILRRDLRSPLMLAALALILIEWLLINTRFRRYP
jgi:Ca-activated chloride channel family protein